MRKSECVLIVFLLASLFADAGYAQGKSHPIGNMDIRVNAPSAVIAAPAVNAMAKSQSPRIERAKKLSAGIAQLREGVSGVDITISPITESVEVVSAAGALTAPAAGISGFDIVKDFIQNNAALYGLTNEDIANLHFIGESKSQASGLRVVRVEQMVNGLPVFQSETRFIIDREGRLIRSVGLLVPDASSTAAAPITTVSAQNALVSAMASVNLTLDPSNITLVNTKPDGRKTEVVSNHPRIPGKAPSELVYFQMAPGILVPAWSQVTMTKGDGDWYTLVDANTGVLLWRKNIRAHASAQEARFSVYVQADGKTPADSPAPFSPTTVSPGSGTQAPGIARSIVNMSAVQNLTASPNGWISDGGTATTGNNVDAYLDRTGGADANIPDTDIASVLDGNGRPTGNPDGFGRNRDFLGTSPRDFTLLPPPQSGNPESGQTATGAGSGGATAIDAFRRGMVTHLFYLTNWYHDQLYSLGFDEAAGNFQSINFSGQGFGNDPVLAEAQDNSGTDNANFSTPPDGYPGRMQMYVFSDPTVDRDGSLDAEIVLHELTHGLSNRLVGNGSGLNWDVGSGIGEGWSDYYALSLLNNTNSDNPNGKYTCGAYATYKLSGLTDNYLYGIRRFPYCTDNTVNPLTWADVDDITLNLSGGIAVSPLNSTPKGGCEVHNIGEIWAMTLWEVRSRIIADPAGANGDVPTGNYKMLQIVTDGMKMTPINPSFIDARDALIFADAATNAGANEKWIWQGFADRGLGYNAVAPYSRMFAYRAGHVSIGESFDVPYLDVQSVAIDDSLGNNNGAIDPGEPIRITVKLKNPWRNSSFSVTSATATLTTSTAGISITTGDASYPAIAALGSADGTKFQFSVPLSATAGQALNFTITPTSTLGTKPVNFTLRVGTPAGNGAPITFTKTISGGLAIPDDSPRGVVSTLTITNDYEIADLNFRIDNLTHAWTGDITALLRAPNGLGTDLVSLLGGAASDLGAGENFVNCVIDDQASGDLLTATAADAPYTGSWKPMFNDASWDSFGYDHDPVGALGRYNGLRTKGDWKVLVSDQSEGDTGTLYSWSLIVTPKAYTVTPLTVPTVTTQAVTSIGPTSATGNGNVTSLGVPNPTSYGVCWNTAGTPTVADRKTDDGAKTSVGAFATSMAGLSPGTLYYVRAYATNIVGTSYGSQVSFTTATTLAGFSISGISGNTTESGGTATFTVKLTAQPAANVSIGLSSSDTSEGTVSPTSLTFTPVNWNTEQVVTVTGVDDSIVDGNVAYSIVTAAATSADLNYNGFNPADVPVTNIDDDAAGFTMSGISGSTTESGGTATFTVRLTSQPSANVSVSLSSSDTSEGAVSPTGLTFTPANWNIDQTVTVTGVDEHIIDGNIAYSIVISPATSSDPNYSGLNPADVAVVNLDNDVAGFTLSKSTSTVQENGGTDIFTVVLTTQPASNVVFGVTSSAPGEATVAPATLTFTPANWNIAQAVTITGVNDSTIGNHTATVTVSVLDGFSDNNWDPLADKTVAVSCLNNDFTLTSSAGLHGTITPSATVESGTDRTFTITPDAHYHVADVLVDGVSVGAVLSYEFKNVTANHTISVTFTIDTFTLTSLAGLHGSVTPTTTVDYGTDRTFTITPDTHYHVADVLVDGVSVGAVLSYEFKNVTANHTISVTFAIDTFTLTSSAGLHGTITPTVNAEYGTNSTLTITPDAHYHVADVIVDGVSVGAVTSYEFRNVTANHTISATFAIDTHTLTYLAVNGSISGSAVQTVEYGSDGNSVTAVPNPDCYLTSWSDGLKTLVRKDANVTADERFTANFRNNVFEDASSIYNLADNAGGQRIFVIKNLVGKKILTVELKDVTGDCDLYLKHGSNPTPQLYNYKSANGQNMNESITVHNPLDGDWHVMVYAYGDYSGAILSVAYGADGLDAPENLAATKGLDDVKIALTWDAVIGADSYEIFRSDVDDIGLAAKINATEITDTAYNDNFADSGTYHYYYWVRAVDGSGNKSEFSDSAYGSTAEGAVITLVSGTAKTAITGPEGSVKTYKIAVPADQTLLEVRISGLTGDCDFDVVMPDYTLTLAPSGTAGGYVKAEIDNVKVVNAANFAVQAQEEILKIDNNDATVALLEIIKAGQQVVAGTNYKMIVRVNVDGRERVAEIVVWEKLSGNGYELASWNYMQLEGTTVRRSISGTSSELVRITGGPLVAGNWFIRLYGATNYSGLSLMAKYSRATAAPAAPAVSATDGTYEAMVVITWPAVAGATSYEIFRNTVNSTSGAGFISLGEVSDLVFEDNTAESGTTYYYFAKAKNYYYDTKTKSITSGVSKFSTGNSGYVANALAVPGAVTASDGTYFDKIRVSWSSVVGATSYIIFRTETATPPPDPAKDEPIVETRTLYFDDFGDDIVPQADGIVKKYYYWAAAKNRNTVTVISKPNDGYLSKKGPATVTASNGTYSNRIVVTWTEVPGATAYDVFRYTDSKFTLNETRVGTAVQSTECENVVRAGITYCYRVKAKYGSGNPIVYKYDSDFSLSAAAGKASGATNPEAIAISNGVPSANIHGAKESIRYFSMDVPSGTARLVATLTGTPPPVGTANDCDLFAKFANYPTTASYTAKGVENILSEILTVSNPAAGTWYFLLYGTMYYSNVSLTVNCYTVADIVLTQVPQNDLAVPFTTSFKGKVVDETGTGIPNIVIQVRNPISGLTVLLTKTDAAGVFSYSTLINSEGEHTFDFFFTEMPDIAKGTASHTVATRKGCLETNNFFDISAYLPATPVAIPLQSDILGLQTFLDIRNGWNDTGTLSPGDTYETMWINDTIANAGNDAQLLSKLDGGLYMFFYGVEGAGVGNDTTANSAFSAVPFVVHVNASKRDTVATHLRTLGLIDDMQKTAILAGKIGIVAVASLSNPDEAVKGNYGICLLAREQLEILANIAAGSAISSEAGKYSDVTAKLLTITLSNGREINVVSAAFVK